MVVSIANGTRRKLKREWDEPVLSASMAFLYCFAAANSPSYAVTEALSCKD